MRIGGWLLTAAGAVALSVPAVAALVQKKTPYFASIGANKARMRTGPGKTYPASWLYQRAELPVKVLVSYDHGQWLKVEDPDGTQGWMLGSLIKEARTAIVKGSILEMHESPTSGSGVAWRAAPGVVGRVSKCAGGWCLFDVHGRAGYVEADRLWGVEPDETLD